MTNIDTIHKDQKMLKIEENACEGVNDLRIEVLRAMKGGLTVTGVSLACGIPRHSINRFLDGGGITFKSALMISEGLGIDL